MFIFFVDTTKKFYFRYTTKVKFTFGFAHIFGFTNVHVILLIGYQVLTWVKDWRA